MCSAFAAVLSHMRVGGHAWSLCVIQRCPTRSLTERLKVWNRGHSISFYPPFTWKREFCTHWRAAAVHRRATKNSCLAPPLPLKNISFCKKKSREGARAGPGEPAKTFAPSLGSYFDHTPFRKASALLERVAPDRSPLSCHRFVGYGGLSEIKKDRTSLCSLVIVPWGIQLL